MLNLFTKTKPWMVVSLLAAAAAFAQQDNTKCRPQKGFDQGHEMMQNQMMPAYNAPARVEVRGSWDIYTTGSFIYWQARQENMELGIISDYTAPFSGGQLPLQSPTVSTIIQPNAYYKPGFKFGLGVNLDWDNWDAYAEYTWFHGTTNTGVSPLIASPLTSATAGQANYLFPKQATPSAAGTTSIFYNSANQTWNLKMDFLDISMARSSYSGTKLSVRPFFGARGAWIRQNVIDLYNGNSGDSDSNAHWNVNVNRSLASWGVGPRAGFESNWMMGYGFRVLGNGSADMLYTRYDVRGTYLRNDVSNPNHIASYAKFSGDHLDTLRAHANLELGLGWGSYFDNNNWHIDLSASYGYQVFWDQNMFPNFNDDVQLANFTVPNGNLYIHGLNLTARLDF